MGPNIQLRPGELTFGEILVVNCVFIHVRSPLCEHMVGESAVEHRDLEVRASRHRLP